MEKCLTVAQKDTCPNGTIDAKCIPYTGGNLANINVTSGQKLDVILSAINTAVGGGSPLSLRIVDLSFNADGTYNIPSGGWLLGIAVNPSSQLSSFKVGTTPGGDDLIYDQLIEPDIYSTFNNSRYVDSSTTFYFGGISAPTDIKLLLL